MWVRQVSDRLMVLRCVETILDDVMSRIVKKDDDGGGDMASVGSRTHGQEVRPQSSSSSADAVRKSSMEGA